MDLDAIGKEIPRFKRIADQMERILANPFVAGTEAERADAMADLQALREFRDRLPEVDRKLDQLDEMVQDVADLKNRPSFDPSMIPQPEAYSGPTEDRVKELIGEAMPSTSAGGGLTEDQVREIVRSTLSSSEIGDHLEAEFNEILSARDDKIAGLQEQNRALVTQLTELQGKLDALPAAESTGQSDLGTRVEVLETKIDGLMDALDVSAPDLGQDAPAPGQTGAAGDAAPVTEAKDPS